MAALLRVHEKPAAWVLHTLLSGNLIQPSTNSSRAICTGLTLNKPAQTDILRLHPVNRDRYESKIPDPEVLRSKRNLFRPWNQAKFNRKVLAKHGKASGIDPSTIWPSKEFIEVCHPTLIIKLGLIIISVMKKVNE